MFNIKKLLIAAVAVTTVFTTNTKADTAIALDLRHPRFVWGIASGGSDRHRLGIVVRDRIRRRGAHNSHMTQLYRTTRQLSGKAVLMIGATPSGRRLAEVRSANTFEAAAQAARTRLEQRGAIQFREAERFVAR